MFNSVTKYSFYLDKNPDKSLRLFVLLLQIENYINGAILEMRRLEKHRFKIKKGFEEMRKGSSAKKNKFLTTYLACDTHFFFVCIDKIYKLFNNLYLETKDSQIKTLKDEINKLFDISTIRNHLEHIEDRCVGYLSLADKNKGIRKNINDFGNFIGDDFSFNGKKFPSGKARLEEIKKIYGKLIKIVDKKCSENPDFVKRKDRDKEHRKLMNALKKADLFN